MQAALSNIRTILRQPLVRFVGGFCCVVILTLFVFRQLGSWLLVADVPPASIDIICTFAGDNKRVDYSKKLMIAHPGAHWVLSDYKDGHGRLLQKNHFDMSRVTIIDTCKSTLSEVTAFSLWLEEYRKRMAGSGAERTVSVALVSSPYHMRRIRIMTERRMSIDSIAVYLLPVPLDKYLWSEDTFRYWWRSNATASITTLEILKLGYFLLTGYF